MRVSGAFLASYLNTVNADQFQFFFSIFILAMVVLGGPPPAEEGSPVADGEASPAAGEGGGEMGELPLVPALEEEVDGPQGTGREHHADGAEGLVLPVS